MARSKGQGSISLRSDGVYMGRITRNGITKTFYSKDKKKVEKQLSDYSYMPASEFQKKNVRVKFQDYMRDYLFTYKYGHIRDSSFDRLERVYSVHIVDSSIGRIPLCELNDIVIQQFLNEKYSTDLSMSQCKKIYELIRSVLYYAYRKNDIAIDYGSIIQFPKATSFKPVKSIEVYTDEDIVKIHDFVRSASTRKELRFVRFAWIYIIMFHTGLRAGEVLALTWNDVDLENKLISIDKTLTFIKDRNGDADTKNINVVVPPKTSAGIRNVPMNDLVVSAFKHLRESYLYFDCLGEYVVCNVNGERIRLRSFEKKFKQLCEKCGVEYKGVHAIRHTFASRMIQNGVSAKIVSDILGHSNVSFTLNRYVHTNEDMKYTAVKCLENV